MVETGSHTNMYKKVYIILVFIVKGGDVGADVGVGNFDVLARQGGGVDEVYGMGCRVGRV